MFRRYDTLRIYALQIIYDEETRRTVSGREEMMKVLDESMHTERDRFDSVLAWLEETMGGCALTAGPCRICPDGCARVQGEPCRFPERKRHSLESLGGDITATLKDILGIDLIWDSDGRLPEYYTLTAGLLYDTGTDELKGQGK